MATTRQKHPAPRLPANTAVRLPPGMDDGGTRGRILREALALFAHRGFHGTSIRDIAEAVGVQTATLYGHFGSKEAILEELLVVGHEIYEAALAAAAEAAGPTPTDQLVAVVRANVLHHIRYAMVAVVSNGELHSLTPAAAVRVTALRQVGENLIVRIIEAGAADGSFAPLDPAVTMAALGSMGLRVANWYPGRLDTGPEELADLYAEMALRLVGARR